MKVEGLDELEAAALEELNLCFECVVSLLGEGDPLHVESVSTSRRSKAVSVYQALSTSKFYKKELKQFLLTATAQKQLRPEIQQLEADLQVAEPGVELLRKCALSLNAWRDQLRPGLPWH